VASGARSAACGAVGGNRAISDAGRTDAGRFPDKFCGERRPEGAGRRCSSDLAAMRGRDTRIFVCGFEKTEMQSYISMVGTKSVPNRIRSACFRKKSRAYRLTAQFGSPGTHIDKNIRASESRRRDKSGSPVSRPCARRRRSCWMARKHPVPLAQQLVFTVVRSVEAPVGMGGQFFIALVEAVDGRKNASGSRCET